MATTVVLPRLANGMIDLEQWLSDYNFNSKNSLVARACNLSRVTEDLHHPVLKQESCFSLGLKIASRLTDFFKDEILIAAAILYPTIAINALKSEDIVEQFGNRVIKLIEGAHRIELLTTLNQIDNRQQIDQFRRMLLAMVSDVRIVMIKLIERLVILQALKDSSVDLKHQIAREIQNIYAPLANRLGIHQLKWELEDISFRYLEPKIYQNIATQLQQRRSERDQNIKNMVNLLTHVLKESNNNIPVKIYGRAKHIYSIYRKMQRKNVDFDEIYDAHAVRILTDNIEHCYEILSVVHQLWTPIEKEFDDYIAKPKPNGYQSIHTAVIGPENKNFEIQIRTQQMDEDAEKGVAAHWLYKEGNPTTQSAQSTQIQQGDNQKIQWLRQLLEWQKEIVQEPTLSSEIETQIFDDRIYVFSPKGEIFDLPKGATVLDFAYTLHTDLGHQCRGAKINQKIVPLIYNLNTGERVEILTSKNNKPSRDWLLPQRNYLKTARARAKVLHYFRQQDSDYKIDAGKLLLEKELDKLKLKTNISLDRIAELLNYKNSDSLLAALGGGDLRLSTILHAIERLEPPKTSETSEKPDKAEKSEKQPQDFISKNKKNIIIYGAGDLLTRIAKCCSPIAGDKIIGYLTQNQGVTIHRQDCNYIQRDQKNHQERVFEVSWRNTEQEQQRQRVNLTVQAYDRPGLIRDITHLLTTASIEVLALNSSIQPKKQLAQIKLKILVNTINDLIKIIPEIDQLPNIIQVNYSLE